MALTRGCKHKLIKDNSAKTAKSLTAAHLHGWVSKLAWKQLGWFGMSAALLVASAWAAIQRHSSDFTISEAQVVIFMCYFPLLKSTSSYA